MFYTTKILQFQFLYNIPKTFYFLKLYLFTGCVGSQVWCMGCRAQGLSSCGRWAWLPCSMWGLNSLKVKVLVAQPCPTLCNPIDRNPPGSSVCGILQARILEWEAIPFSRDPSQPRDRIPVSCIAGGFFFTIWAPGEASNSSGAGLSGSQRGWKPASSPHLCQHLSWAWPQFLHLSYGNHLHPAQRWLDSSVCRIL